VQDAPQSGRMNSSEPPVLTARGKNEKNLRKNFVKASVLVVGHKRGLQPDPEDK